MGIEFEANKPIYVQLMHRIEYGIIRSDLQPGEKLPSVRDYAVEVGVNPNTIQRVYRELEEQGIVVTRRGQGTFVTNNGQKIDILKEEKKQVLIKRFIKDMENIGYDLDAVISTLHGEQEEPND